MRSRSRGLTSTAAFAAGGLGTAAAGLVGLLAAEAKFAHATVHAVELQPPPNATGWYGHGRSGAPLRVALLGDSSAAGYGLEDVEETPGALLAGGISEQTGRPVRLDEVAVVGALSADLDLQVDRAIALRPDVAVILIGANDVVRLKRPSVSVRHLARGVRRLREAGIEVVVGTCPDLGTVQPILPPLRQVVRVWSRRIAAEQTVHTIRAGGRTLSLADILGAEFRAQPGFFFGPDKFHPSAPGYAALAAVLVPSALAALGLVEDEEADLEAVRGRVVLPIAAAALRAVNRQGTELDPTQMPPRRFGVRGLWVTLRRRRRGAVHRETPTAEEATAD
ncbi:SGNH/GDSL hydrolase family protein [Nocardioides sp. AN3]